MKKIGIMSMQRIINYGSYLQAYGLYNTIRQLGYDVEFIDYHYECSLVKSKKNGLLKKLKKNINIIKFYKRKKQYINFKKSIKDALKPLNVTENYNYNKKIDTLVIGSDEVFNCLQGYPVGYSLELFGKNFESSKIISYAASFGYTTLDMLKDYNIDDDISQLLKKFYKISVRDENSKKIVETLTGIKPIVSFDPVIISDYSDKIKSVKPDDNYIILYAYQGRISKSEGKYIKEFAKKHNKKIISLGFYQEIADKNIAVSPFDVLNYFKFADYIITDTFHGTIFSIKMNNKFCTIVRDSNFNKLNSLLKSLSQTDRIVYNLDDIERLYNTEVDYVKTNNIIQKAKEDTINYLKENL